MLHSHVPLFSFLCLILPSLVFWTLVFWCQMWGYSLTERQRLDENKWLDTVVATASTLITFWFCYWETLLASVLLLSLFKRFPCCLNLFSSLPIWFTTFDSNRAPKLQNPQETVQFWKDTKSDSVLFRSTQEIIWSSPLVISQSSIVGALRCNWYFSVYL